MHNIVTAPTPSNTINSAAHTNAGGLRSLAKRACICFAVCVGFTGASNALAQTNIHLQLNAGQPTTRHYVPARPAPQRMQWVPGHWVYAGGHHHRRTWVDGHWAPRKPAHHARYQNPRWDRDGDGVANRYDRKPDNARRW